MFLPELKPIRRASEYRCPDCQIYMTPFQCREVVIERCLRCQGIWFDKKELGVFADTLKSLPSEEIRVQEPERPDQTVLSSCPRCQLLLQEGTYAYNSKVKIKTCGRCAGIWMPYAELIRFIDYVRLGKLIEPDLKVMLASYKEFQGANTRYLVWIPWVLATLLIVGMLILFPW